MRKKGRGYGYENTADIGKVGKKTSQICLDSSAEGYTKKKNKNKRRLFTIISVTN